jgi:signal transduction histidine kinase/CheY-like chemotaxis protein
MPMISRRPQLFIGALGLAIVALGWLLAVFVADRRTDALFETAKHDTANLAEALEEETGKTVLGVDQVLRLIQARYELDPSSFDLDRWSGGTLAGDSGELLTRIVGPDGHVVGGPAAGIDSSERDYFKVQAARPDVGLYIGQPFKGRHTGRTLLALSRRLSAADGGFSGVAVAAVDVSYLARLLGNVEIGHGVAVIIGSDGIIRAAARDGALLPADEALSFPGLQHAAAREPDGTGRLTGPLDDVERLYSYRTVEGLPIVVAIGLSVSDIQAVDSGERQTELLFGLAITALFLILLALLGRELDRRQRGAAAMARQRDDLTRLNRQLAESEATLAERTNLLEMTLDHTDQGITVVDKTLKIRLLNRRACEMMNLPAQGLMPDLETAFVARHVWEQQRLAEPSLTWEEFTRQARTISVATVRERRSPDGRTYEVRNIPLPDGGAIRTSSDVTDRVEAERDLRAAKEAAESAMAARSAFLATMSHEIRTPLNGVIGLSSLLMDTALNETQRGYLSLLRRSADHLLLLVNDVLDFSKLDAGRVELETCSFVLAETVENVVAILSPRATAKGLDFSYTIDPAVPDKVSGDPGRLSQILFNLAGNAVKFTERGRVSVAVSVVQMLPDALELRFDVADSGIGIQPEALPRLFTEFSQLDGSITRRYGGTGLGLAISNRLVALMGGRMEVASEPNIGSVFSFTIRFATGGTADNTIDAPLPPSPSLHAPLAGRRLWVLLAEDNPTNQLVARTIMENQGCRVDVAANGAEAVRAVRERAYDIVIMDIMMPEIGGLEAARMIRALPPPRCFVPIVAMTANAFAQDREACLAAGMNGFLAKPATAAKLIGAILASLGTTPVPTAAPEPEPPPPAESVLDDDMLTMLEQECGEALPDLLRLFLTECEKRVVQIQNEARAGVGRELEREAHTLKGAAISFGCPALSDAARRVEAAAMSGKDELPRLVQAVQHAHRLARAALLRRYPLLVDQPAA